MEIEIKSLQHKFEGKQNKRGITAVFSPRKHHKYFSWHLWGKAFLASWMDGERGAVMGICATQAENNVFRYQSNNSPGIIHDKRKHGSQAKGEH